MTIGRLNLDEVRRLPDVGPVTMLNLMRFRERSLDGNGSGWDAYLRYSALAIKLIKARGGTIAWTGQAEGVVLGRASLALRGPRPLSVARRLSRHDDVSRLPRRQHRARERLRGSRHHRRARNLQQPRQGEVKEPTMSLEEKLAATRAAAVQRIPADRAAIMDRATEDLRRSGVLDRIVRVGAKMPAFELANHDGRRVSSEDLLAGGPLVLSFFRGSW
jgi:hypothetical protein